MIAPRRKRQPPPPPRSKPKPRWVRAGKWVIGAIGTILGVVAAYFAIWEVWLRTVPTVVPPDVTETFDVLPFTVTNQSPFFQMYSVALMCETTSYGLILPGSSKRHKIASRAVRTPFDIPPEQSSKMKCRVPFLWNDPTLKMTDARVLGEIAKVKMATLAVSAKFETNRESDPVSYAWETTRAGQHYWAPYDPNSVPVDKYYSDTP
jgi:hypothetical protein